MYKIRLAKIAIENIEGMDSRTQKQLISKIESLKDEPLLLGRQLRGPLNELRSVRAAGQRFQVIYKVDQVETIVVIIAVGIREDGDKNDIYELMKKYIKVGLMCNG